MVLIIIRRIYNRMQLVVWRYFCVHEFVFCNPLETQNITMHSNRQKKKIRSVLFMMSVDEFCFMVENDVKIQNIPFDTNGSEKI